MQSYIQSPQKANCPVCCNSDAHLLWNISSKQAAQHFILKETDPDRFDKLVLHIESLWEQTTCDIVKCDQCGFCYSNPFVAGDRQFYTLAYNRSGYPKWKWEFQMTYDVLNKTFDSDAILIEIGAGDGAFIKKITGNIIPKENLFCTEFSNYGSNQIKNFGVPCLSKDIRDTTYEEIKGNVDAICLFQVLEHMDRIDVLFKKLNSLLKQNGSIFIAVPNQNLIEFNELNGALLDMPPNHIGRWNKECFQILGKRFGFRIKDYKIENTRFLSMAEQFVTFRFLRKAQKSGSLSNKIQNINDRRLKKIALLFGFAVNSVAAIPALINLNSGLGNSQWVHLVKTETV